MTNKYIKISYQLVSILQIIPVYKMLGSKKKKKNDRIKETQWFIPYIFYSLADKSSKKNLIFRRIYFSDDNLRAVKFSW